MNSDTLAILFLALVGAILVYAALYALMGKPSTSQGKKRKQEVINGLGFVLMGGLVGFAGIAIGATPSSFAVSRPFAAVISVSALIFIALMSGVRSGGKYRAVLDSRI